MKKLSKKQVDKAVLKAAQEFDRTCQDAWEFYAEKLAKDTGLEYDEASDRLAELT